VSNINILQESIRSARDSSAPMKAPGEEIYGKSITGSL